MKCEIDRDFYCTGVDIRPMNSYYCKEKLCARCENKHRKWPTPEQYRAEYGEDYPETGAVYTRSRTPQGEVGPWYCAVLGLKDALNIKLKGLQTQIVCACTPWGKPPADWRPE